MKAIRRQPTRRVRDIVTRLHDLPLSSAMIAGETGTGKGLIARVLHYTEACGQGPFVEVNCVALPKDMLPPSFSRMGQVHSRVRRVCTAALRERLTGARSFSTRLARWTPLCRSSY